MLGGLPLTGGVPNSQVFVALLRLCQADNKKALVRDALDTLTPVLVRRLAPGDLKYPIWVRYTKKVLVEEGHSTPHLIHIWQLLVRHADLYYSSRSASPLSRQSILSAWRMLLPQVQGAYRSPVCSAALEALLATALMSRAEMPSNHHYLKECQCVQDAIRTPDREWLDEAGLAQSGLAREQETVPGPGWAHHLLGAAAPG